MKRLIFLTLFLAGCQSEPADSRQAGGRPDPAEVLRRYQSYIDSNQFADAQRLSTPAERERIDMMARILNLEDPDSSILHTRFLDTRCEVTADTARCRCDLEDEYERYVQTFRLIWTQGQWLVDAPDEEIIIEEVMVDSLVR